MTNDSTENYVKNYNHNDKDVSPWSPQGAGRDSNFFSHVYKNTTPKNFYETSENSENTVHDEKYTGIHHSTQHANNENFNGYHNSDNDNNSFFSNKFNSSTTFMHSTENNIMDNNALNSVNIHGIGMYHTNTGTGFGSEFTQEPDSILNTVDNFGYPAMSAMAQQQFIEPHVFAHIDEARNAERINRQLIMDAVSRKRNVTAGKWSLLKAGFFLMALFVTIVVSAGFASLVGGPWFLFIGVILISFAMAWFDGYSKKKVVAAALATRDELFDKYLSYPVNVIIAHDLGGEVLTPVNSATLDSDRVQIRTPDGSIVTKQIRFDFDEAVVYVVPDAVNVSQNNSTINQSNVFSNVGDGNIRKL